MICEVPSSQTILGSLSLNSSKTEIYYHIYCLLSLIWWFPKFCRVFLSAAGNPKQPWVVQPSPGENLTWLWWVLIFKKRRRGKGKHLAWKWGNKWMNFWDGKEKVSGEVARIHQHSLNCFAELTTASDESGCLKLRQIWTKYANQLQQLARPLWGHFSDAQKFLHIWRRTCGRWCCSRLGSNFWLK